MRLLPSVLIVTAQAISTNTSNPGAIMDQRHATGEPDIECAAMELWRLTKEESPDWDWEGVNDIRKTEYRRIATAILSAAGCLNGLRRDLEWDQEEIGGVIGRNPSAQRGV